MRDFLTQYYLPMKALHWIFIISWMAALLYLPRLFVYHSDAPLKGELSQTLKIMERRLARFIMTPAMLGAFLLGGLLFLTPGVVSHGAKWFHLKFLCVIILAGFHGFLIATMKRFERDERPLSAKAFRFLNEVPTFLMIIIVFLVVIKPF